MLRAITFLLAGALLTMTARSAEPLQARTTADGQVEIREGKLPVLRYNYRTVEAGELLAKVTEGNRIYAKPRSDYIHPLYGLSGEVLTRDWAIDHPHHRGIYWAWPEVDFGNLRGDLHALQKVFARPTGKLQLENTESYAQIEAENHWLWEDREPIVRETTVIRAWRSTPQARLIDLTFTFLALHDNITVARRGTEAYGGLNLRLVTPREQQIVTNTAPAAPLRAWSDLSGVFSPGTGRSGLMVMQHPSNPDHPGDWVQYPELSWCQPTFPASGKRYGLSRSEPLVLKYRLRIHSGGAPAEAAASELWDAFAAGLVTGGSRAGE